MMQEYRQFLQSCLVIRNFIYSKLRKSFTSQSGAYTEPERVVPYNFVGDNTIISDM